ncbi:phosphatidate cytidylyltransferase [Micromonospora echinospora]|uniref:Phosphatidate cytidylyltransferase n=1 Tax=Micromonospora echinospora TaxID=1877 RepID=A0A1C4UNQ5_MICEC|nr:phosphatidate cytidylyltransferase [Micromonospora echinospora]OZV77598.1 phosphatidate cytidylyltransferase [Micromonospora echinospora]SCE73262.1 phosphatidate cytidylyltransferase [Micromonospora echinospora]
MSHLDSYGSIEPRGRDRAARPALPWPEHDLGPGSQVRQAYADQPVVTWTPEEYDEARTDDQPTLVPGHPDFDRAWSTGPVPTTGGPDPHHPAGAAGPDPYPGPEGDPYAEPADPGPDPEPGTAPDPSAYDPVRPAGTAEPAPERPPGRWRGRRRPIRGGGSAAAHGRSSRAGRNLPAAIAVGLALGALILVPLFTVIEAFLGVLAVAVAVGMWEMGRAVRRADARPPMVPLIAGGVLTVGLAWWSGPDALMLGLLVTLAATLVWRLAEGKAGLGRDMTAATLIAVYVPFLAGFAALLAAVPDDGHLRVLVTLVAVVLSDTGGYAAGANFGKRKMAPTISPSKSWEGFYGSVGAAALGSALLIWLLFDVAPWWGALFGAAVSVAAVLGDLAESMIKRDLGIKDMSNLLPGHGGLMDRLDSILFAVPTAYLLLAVFAPVVS